MNNNESQLLKLLDNKHYQEAIDFIFQKKDFANNDNINSLSLIGKENLFDLFMERENYLNCLNSHSKKKIPSYSKFPILKKFSEEFNILEDMFVEQSLNKVGFSSIDALMDKMSESSVNGIFPFSDTDNKPSPFIIPKQKTYDAVINFVKNRDWNGVERRAKPR
jgi:hypothetical protein